MYKTTHELAKQLLSGLDLPLYISTSNVRNCNVKKNIVIKEVTNGEKLSSFILESQDELDYIQHLKDDVVKVSSWTEDTLKQAYEYYLLRYNSGDFKDAEDTSISFQKTGSNVGEIFKGIPFNFHEFKDMLVGYNYRRSRMCENLGGVISSKGGDGTKQHPYIISVLPNSKKTDYRLGDLK